MIPEFEPHHMIPERTWKCRIRLCKPGKIIFDGIAVLGDKKNHDPVGVYATEMECEACHRRVRIPWDTERVKDYRKQWKLEGLVNE